MDSTEKPLDGTSEPSPPRPPSGKAEALKLIGGLVVVCVGLGALIAIALVAMRLVKDTDSSVVATATSAFGVIGSVVGAYFGVKIGTDGTQSAIAGMKEEAAKAQAFAAHVPEGQAGQAIAQAQALASGDSMPAENAPRPPVGPDSGEIGSN